MPASHSNRPSNYTFSIQLAELCLLEAILSLANRCTLDPDHKLHNLLNEASDAYQVRPRTKNPFVPAAWKLLNDLVKLCIRDSQEKNRRCLKGIHSRSDTNRTGGRRFILLLPQTAALPESDAGSGVINPALSFAIQNCQTSYSMWCPMYRARC